MSAVANEYLNVKFDVVNLLDRIGQELEKPQTAVNYGHVDQLKALRQELIEALSGMTGMSEHSIRETLEDIQSDYNLQFSVPFEEE
jgi:hypothetical protein